MSVSPVLNLIPTFAQADIVMRDGADEFRVIAPPANSIVRKSVEIKYVVYDDDASSIPTKIELLNASCTEKRRTILNSNLPSKKTTQVLGWNTEGGYSDGAALGDGEYCFSICADFKKDEGSYNVCNRRKLTIRNVANTAPKITSLPTTRVAQGANYSYTIIATDPDNNRLSYRVTQKPGFLNFNGTTLSGVASRAGVYQIVIEVSDEFGGLARQTYNLTVTAPAVNPTPTPGGPGENPGQPAQPLTASATFIYPQGNTIFSGADNLIEWSIENQENVATVTLEVKSTSGRDWIKIFQAIGDDAVKNQKQFNWNVSDVPEGEYELKLRLDLKDNGSTETVSNKFMIDNEAEPPLQTMQISVSDIVPANGGITDEKRPEISARITLSANLPELLIEQLKLTIDDEDITETCKIDLLNASSDSVYKLSCALKEDLSVGNHIAKLHIDLGITDQPQLKTEREWQFNVADNLGGDEDTIIILGFSLPRSAMGILVVICLVLLLLILLPFILYTVWKRRTATYSSTVTSKTLSPTTIKTVTNTAVVPEAQPVSSMPGAVIPVTRTSEITSYKEVKPVDPFANPLPPLSDAPTATEKSPQVSTPALDTAALPVLPPAEAKTEADVDVETSKSAAQGSQSDMAKVAADKAKVVTKDISSWFKKQKDKVAESVKDIQDKKAEAKRQSEVNKNATSTPVADTINTSGNIFAPVSSSTSAPKSTADILASDYSLADTDLSDNPLAPVAPSTAQASTVPPVVQPSIPVSQAPSAPSNLDESNTRVPTTTTITVPAAPTDSTQLQTTIERIPAPDSTVDTSVNTSSISDDSLPDWLKDDPTSDSGPALPVADLDSQLGNSQGKSTKSKVDDSEDDGSDPYGFGDYSL